MRNTSPFFLQECASWNRADLGLCLRSGQRQGQSSALLLWVSGMPRKTTINLSCLCSVEKLHEIETLVSFFVRQRNQKESQQTAKSTAHTLGWTDYGSFKNPCNVLSVIRPDIFVTFPRYGLSLDKNSLFRPFGIFAR